MTPTRVRVGGGQPYDVVVGRGLRGEVAGLLGTGVRKVLIIHPAVLAVAADRLREELQEHGLDAFLAEVPDAEEGKTAAVAEFCWQVLGQTAFTRTDAIVGLGGGATTDLAGFVAATWLRGIRVVHVATTLLGMVDAAVGGKTAINTAEGKNLVGAFYPPAGVLCDLATLATLPKADLAGGLAEVIKIGFIADTRILELVEAHGPALLDADHPALPELVERSVRVKAQVVSEDLREAGLREILNYGHTFGHAVEQVEGYTWRHGEAVSVGMVFAAELSRLTGRLDEDDVARHRAVLTAVGLPVSYRGDRWEQLLTVMRRDKKARGDVLRLVVLDGIGRPVRLEGPDPELLVGAYRRIAQ